MLDHVARLKRELSKVELEKSRTEISRQSSSAKSPVDRWVKSVMDEWLQMGNARHRVRGSNEMLPM